MFIGFIQSKSQKPSKWPRRPWPLPSCADLLALPHKAFTFSPRTFALAVPSALRALPQLPQGLASHPLQAFLQRPFSSAFSQHPFRKLHCAPLWEHIPYLPFHGSCVFPCVFPWWLSFYKNQSSWLPWGLVICLPWPECMWGFLSTFAHDSVPRNTAGAG